MTAGGAGDNQRGPIIRERNGARECSRSASKASADFSLRSLHLPAFAVQAGSRTSAGTRRNTAPRHHRRGAGRASRIRRRLPVGGEGLADGDVAAALEDHLLNLAA